MNAIDRAYQLLGSGRVAEAVETLEKAGRAGEADSWLELAVWYLQPIGVERDLGRARDCFEKAAMLGHKQARMVHLSLVANGTGGPPEWARALELLSAAAAEDPDARRQLDLLEQMEISDGGEPRNLPQPKPLSDSPEVRLFPSLLTHAECAYLIDAASSRFAPAVVVDPRTGRMAPHPVRTSENAFFAWVDENPVIHAVNRRLAAASATDVSWGEPLQILRYRGGQQYRPHHDAVAGADNQRILTMLVYLNEGYSGGETRFLSNGLDVRGRTGDALLFRNASNDGAPDPAAEHAGLPVTAGEKLIASRWIRQRRFGPAA